MVDFGRPQLDAPTTETPLMPYLRALRSHRLLVAVITLIAFVAAIGYLAVHKRSYQATAQMLVTPLPETDQFFLGTQMIRDSGDPTRTAQTAAQVVDTPAAAALAANHLGHGLTGRDVQQDVTVNPLGQSNILAIVATANSASLAAQMANGFAKAALQSQDAIVYRQVQALLAMLKLTPNAPADRIAALEAVARSGDPTLSISEAATIPSSPSGAPSWLILALALLAGFCIASIVAVLVERFDPIIRDTEVLTSIYSLPILSRVPRLSRRERRAISLNEFDFPPHAREAYRLIQAQLHRDAAESRTVMLTSASKGDGKTSVAIQLSIVLAAAGNSVVLIDCDFRKPDVGRRLRVKGNFRLSRLLSPDASLEELLVTVPEIPGLRVLPADQGPGGVMLLETVSRRLAEIFREASEIADFVVVDTPPLGEISDALRLAENLSTVIVVARPGVTDRRSYTQMRDLLDRTGIVPIGMVLIGEPGVTGAYYGYASEKSRSLGLRWSVR